MSDMQERVARFKQYQEEGRLLRNEWRGTDEQGRETACWLRALAPEVDDSPEKCPSHVMPTWFAHLVPWMDDSGSLAAWPAAASRLARLMLRWHVLNEASWVRLEYAAKRVSLRSARRNAGDSGVVVDTVLSLLDRACTGDVAAESVWSAARLAAESAESAADEITTGILDELEAAIAVAELQ